MKRSTLMKLTLVVVTLFVFGGAIGQTYLTPILTNYVEATETSYQTTGLGLTLYAHPDPVYSPSYDNTTNTGYNAGSTWQWVHGVDFATGTILKAWSVDNFVALAAGDIPAAGATRTYWAAERFGAACADAIGKSHVVTVLPVPSAVMIGANTGAAWSVTTADRVFYRCDDGHIDDLSLTFTETGVPVAYDNYAYTITVTSTGYDADGNIVVGPTNETATYGVSVAATDATFVGPTATVAIPAPLTFVQDGGVDVQTKYEFTLATVASKISTISHTRAGVANAFYPEAGANDLVTYWLNLPPVTGPIYHIPNNFAL